jgi:hypothetical protein
MTIEKVLSRVHFCFLYVLMYSTFRNLNWLVDFSERSAVFIKWLAIAFFFWYFGINAFLYFRDQKIIWDRNDNLSVWVVIGSLTIIGFLEYLVFSS